MKYVLAALVAIACLAVISVSAIWWIDRDAAIKAAAQRKADIEAARDWGQRAECNSQVKVWDSGNRDGLIRKYGDYAEQRIKHCRWLYSIK